MTALTAAQLREVASREDFERDIAGMNVIAAIDHACRRGQLDAEFAALATISVEFNHRKKWPSGRGGKPHLFAAMVNAAMAIVASGVAQEEDVKDLYAPFQKSIPLQSLPRTVLVTHPRPTTNPNCNQPRRNAAIIVVSQPYYPEKARTNAVGGTTVVKVTLNEKGEVTNTAVYRSSGSRELDNAVIHAARTSKYSPAVEACQPVSGVYLFRATFKLERQT